VARVIGIQNVERRRDRRQGVLLNGQLDAHPVKIVNVSFGGVGGAIDILGSSDYTPPEGVNLPLVIESASGRVEDFIVQVTRVNGRRGTFGARFVEMTDHQFRVLEKMTTGRPF
jgi:hypothetical protein